MFKLRHKQQSALLYLTHPDYWHIVDIAFGGSAECGKSVVASAWMIGMCMNPEHSDLYYAAATYDITKSEQTIRNKIDEVAKYMGLKKDIDYTYNIKQHTFKFTKTGSRIILFGLTPRAGDPNHNWIRGYEFTGAWIDESDTVDKDLIVAFKNRLGRVGNYIDVPIKDMTNQEKIDNPEYKQYNGYKKMIIPKKLLQTFNPTRAHPYETFYLPHKNNEEVNTKFIRAFIYDNYPPNHPRIKEWEEKPNSIEKEIMFYGNFEAAASKSSVFSYEHLDNMFNEDNKDGVMSAVIDVATTEGGANDDSTTIGIFDGLNNIYVEEIRGKRFSEDYIKYLKSITDKWGVANENIVVDSNVAGSHVATSKYFAGCLGFKAQKGAIKSKSGLGTVFSGNKNILVDIVDSPYDKLRDQCVVVLSEKIRDGKFSSSIKDGKIIDKIKTELMQYERTESPSGKIRVTSKSNIRKKLRRSTDLSDLYVMRMYLSLIGETRVPVKHFTERKFYKQSTQQPTYE